MRRLIIAVIRIIKDILIFAILTYKLLLLLFELPPIFTWLLSNLQILIINYVFQQLIYSRLFSGKSDSDLCTLFSDRTLINRRNVTGDLHSSFRAKRDFLHAIFQSRVITAAMTVLGFADKSSAPEHYPLPKRHGENEKSPETWGPPWHLWKGGWFFHFPVGWRIAKTSGWSFDWRGERYFAAAKTYCQGEISLQIRRVQQVIQVQWQNKKEPWTVPWSTYSLIFDGSLLLTQSSPGCTAPPEETKAGDDVYNYNCALLTRLLFIFQFS